MSGPDTPKPTSEVGIAENTRNAIGTHFDRLNNPDDLSDKANRDGSPVLAKALNNPLFKANTDKQESLRETTLAKGKENAVKLISALRDAQNIADKASEIKSISAVLGVDISDYMDPNENPMDAANDMNEDRLYDMAYYGSFDTTIARWNGTPNSPVNEQDAGAAVATNEERK